MNHPLATLFEQFLRERTYLKNVTLAECPASFRFLVRDRDQKFTASFDDVFRGSGLEIVRTPFRAPQANGVAERFVRTGRSECLDWPLILGDQHLERVLNVFVEHYNGHPATPSAGPQAARPDGLARGGGDRAGRGSRPASRSSRWCGSRNPCEVRRAVVDRQTPSLRPSLRPSLSSFAGSFWPPIGPPPTGGAAPPPAAPGRKVVASSFENTES
jgi:hypothetical protein